MLSNTTSSIELRRKSHRRQNSTPSLEVPNVRPFPAPIQRMNPARGHRRGLSLDQHIALQPRERMIPTLGPIAQDDISVSLTDTGHNQHPQHPLQVAQQHSMAQPGQPHYENEQFYHHHQPNGTPTLSVDTVRLQQHPPSHPPTPTLNHEQPSQHLFPSPQTPHHQRFTPSPQTSQSATFGPGPSLSGPCEEAVKKLKESVEAVYGPGSNVFINILPTPVATPQKRASTAPAQQMDTAPIPLEFGGNDGLGLGMEHSHSSQGFEVHNSPEGSFYSPGFGSPAHSPYHSPVQQPMHFMEQSHPQLNFDDQPVLGSAHFNSSQTTLADVEPMYSPTHGSMSPDRSPHQMSIADLSLDTIIEDTGVSNEEVTALFEHDPNTNTFTCLYEGCGRKGFQRRENVRSHVQTHLGDRQYKCLHCHKTFVRPHDLKRHAKIHSGVKPYQCPCGQDFVRQDALTRHRQRGSCSGAFADAIPRTPARRGRPRKKRPDLDDRQDKANRTRAINARRGHAYSGSSGGSSYGGSGSEAENSPSPEPTMAGASFDFNSLDTAKLVDFGEEAAKQEQLEADNTEPFSFDSLETSSPCDASSPFDSGNPPDMLFQLSSSSATAPTPPDSPAMKVEPFILSDLQGMTHGSEDVFFGANDMKDTSAFWM